MGESVEQYSPSSLSLYSDWCETHSPVSDASFSDCIVSDGLSDDTLFILDSSSIFTASVVDESMWNGPSLHRRNFKYNSVPLWSPAATENGMLSTYSHSFGAKVVEMRTQQSRWSFYLCCATVGFSLVPCWITQISLSSFNGIARKAVALFASALGMLIGNQKWVRPEGCVETPKLTGVALFERLTTCCTCKYAAARRYPTRAGAQSHNCPISILASHCIFLPTILSEGGMH